MKESLQNYLRSEKVAALLYLFMGTATLTAGAFLFFRSVDRFWQGLSIPLFLFSLIFLWSGIQQLQRTAFLQRELPPLLNRHPARFRAEEMERCLLIDRRYNRKRLLLLLLITMGIFLTLAGGVFSTRPFSTGMGFGICLQGAALLVLDLTSQWRNGIYYHEVDRFE